MILFMSPYYVTRTPTNESALYSSHDKDVVLFKLCSMQFIRVRVFFLGTFRYILVKSRALLTSALNERKQLVNRLKLWMISRQDFKRSKR